MRIVFSLFVRSFSLFLFLSLRIPCRSFARDRDDTITPLFQLFQLRPRRVQDERKREREREIRSKLDRICGRGEGGARAVFRQQLLLLLSPSSPSSPLYSLYFKPSSRLPPETGTRVKSLFPSCSFSLSLLSESCCWKVLLGEMLSSLGKGREGLEGRFAHGGTSYVHLICDTRSEKEDTFFLFSFFFYFWMDNTC